LPFLARSTPQLSRRIDFPIGGLELLVWSTVSPV